MAKNKGAVAAGHELTVKTAETILRNGGNAFDAAVAAHLTACVAEPVLSSLGGGGFLMAHKATGKQVLYDFFVQTPLRKSAAEELDFYPIQANFGSVKQEFHIGAGSVATPGTIKGLFAVHRDLCTIPISELAKPAITLARSGVEVNAFQAYIFDIIDSIYASNPDTKKVFENTAGKATLPEKGDVIRMPLFADFLENLVLEGEDLFYKGEVARSVTEICSDGAGHLQMDDLIKYEPVKRTPLNCSFNGMNLVINPPPSSAGILIAFGLNVLEETGKTGSKFGSPEYLRLLTDIMRVTNKARVDAISDGVVTGSLEKLLDKNLISTYSKQIRNRSSFNRGTTHITIADSAGNIASLSTSNGEGCGTYIPKTGIMLNNMLGEEDLNETGFHNWNENERMTSMMAPGILFDDKGNFTAFGSGGSNRIRTAILQVLLNVAVHDMDLKQAVDSPRMHIENGHIHIEDGFTADVLNTFLVKSDEYTIWPEKNLFFGGVHAVQKKGGQITAHGDPRRGGVSGIIH